MSLPTVDKRSLHQGVDPAIAGTRLAYHLRQIERDHTASQEARKLAGITLSGKGHTRESWESVFSAFGNELRRWGGLLLRDRRAERDLHGGHRRLRVADHRR